MSRRTLATAAATALLVAGTFAASLATSTAALADPPWARGGYRHGGPPPWAPAHGWRRKHDWGYGGGYRPSRFREERRPYGYRY